MKDLTKRTAPIVFVVLTAVLGLAQEKPKRTLIDVDCYKTNSPCQVTQKLDSIHWQGDTPRLIAKITPASKQVRRPVAAATAGHSANLTWADSDTVTGFNVYRNPGTCPATLPTPPGFTKLNSALVTTTTYSDTTVTAGNTYCYYVTAFATAESAPSNLVTAGPIPIFAPTGLTATVQ